MNSKQQSSEVEQFVVLRQKKGWSQTTMYTTIGVPVRTGQGWEQGRGHPSGPALVLIKLILKRPDLLTALLMEDMNEVHS